MADEPSTNSATEPNTPDPQGKAPTQGASGDATTKTYTEAEVNAMVADRLAKNEKSLRKTLEAEQAEAKRQAELSAEERAKELEKKLAEAESQAEARIKAAERKASIAGKVTDPEYALFKIEQTGDKYLDKDGNVNLEALVKDHPTLQAQPTPRTGPAPTTAGGGTTKGIDMNSHIRQKAGRS